MNGFRFYGKLYDLKGRKSYKLLKIFVGLNKMKKGPLKVVSNYVYFEGMNMS